MMKGIIRKAILGLFFSGLLLAGAHAADDAVIVAHDGWLRQPPATIKEAAIYVVIDNHSAQRRMIVSGSTELAETVELHEMKMDHMVMRMNRVPNVEIPAKGKVSFNPNGLHIMLFGLKKRPLEGETVTVTLMLDDGTTVPVSAMVRKK